MGAGLIEEQVIVGEERRRERGVVNRDHAHHHQRQGQRLLHAGVHGRGAPLAGVDSSCWT